MEGNADGIFAKEELLPMTKIALPSILQQSTVSIGMMLVQSVVNSFGAEALAGFSAGMRIESICVVPMVAIGNAISSYTAQNIGAGQQKRVVKGYVQANKLVIFFAVLICVVLELFPRAADHTVPWDRGQQHCFGNWAGLSRIYGIFLWHDWF